MVPQHTPLSPVYYCPPLARLVVNGSTAQFRLTTHNFKSLTPARTETLSGSRGKGNCWSMQSMLRNLCMMTTLPGILFHLVTVEIIAVTTFLIRFW